MTTTVLKARRDSHSRQRHTDIYAPTPPLSARKLKTSNSAVVAQSPHL